MLLQAIIATAATFIAMVVNYLFHFAMTKMLSPEVYGELSILIALYSYIMMPATVLQVFFTREMSKSKKDLFKGYLKFSLLLGLFFSTILFFSSTIISSAIKDKEMLLPIRLISIAIPFAFILSSIRSYYQSKENAYLLSALIIADPLIKIASALLLVYYGFGLIGATIGIAIPSLILNLIFSKLYFRKGSSEFDLSILKPITLILLIQVMLAFIFYIDLFFVRYYLGPEQTGYYNAVSITSKVIAYSIGGISIVTYPKYAKADMKKDMKKVKNIMLKSVLFILPIFFVFILMPEFIIKMLYTERYVVAKDAFVVLCFGMLLNTIFRITMDFMISQKMEKNVLFIAIIAVIVDIVLMNVFIPSKGLIGAALATTLTSAVMLLLGLVAVKI
ncbi:MAG: oligosaccharide flippase family protein [Candidatus Aenigmatarchaeota archaeon]|nr:oligosaccharide flippase family protein [Candidatus Aenigmarchaeota archaeon]